MPKWELQLLLVVGCIGRRQIDEMSKPSLKHAFGSTATYRLRSSLRASRLAGDFEQLCRPRLARPRDSVGVNGSAGDDEDHGIDSGERGDVRELKLVSGGFCC